MGHTNQTANYNLPQFVGTDKPSWLGDINDAFAAIDTAIAAAASEASTADGKADALGTTVSGHTTQIGTLQNTVTTQGNTLNTVTSLIGNGTPTTTDQTIIGAINELNAKEGNLSDLTTTDKSSLVAAINEAAAGGGGGGTESIEVTADGTKTYSQLLNELFALIDTNKLNGKSYMYQFNGTTDRNYYRFMNNISTGLSFVKTDVDASGNLVFARFDVKASSSGFGYNSMSAAGAGVYTDGSSGTLPSGYKLGIVY